MQYRVTLLGGIDAEATFFSGQAFRWQKNNDRYEAVVGDYFVSAKVLGSDILLEASGGAKQFWENYFAADTDYSALREQFMADAALAPCVRYAPGIRMLRQPFFETLCTFIISQNNNIPRITGIVKRLCESFGQNLGNGHFAFPSPQALAAQTQESLAPLRAGFRARYLLDAAQKICSGEVNEAELLRLNADDARKMLCTIVGVGPKVADCVMLYSLNKNEIIPMDVHMKRAMQERFPNGLSPEIAPLGGIAQLYIFHHERTAGEKDK